MFAVQGVGGGAPFMLLSNIFDTNGEGVGGGIPPYCSVCVFITVCIGFFFE